MADDVREALLARLRERRFLTTAGTETFLVFQQGFELPEFAAFTVLEDEPAWSKLQQDYLSPIFATAADQGFGLIVDALVWRAQPDYLRKLGRDAEALESINRRAVEIVRSAVEGWRGRRGLDASRLPILIAADLGPRGDGYRIEGAGPDPEVARAYHRPQLESLAAAGVDLACALTMTSLEESIGIVRACGDVGLPVIVSPTVETDGRLPDGRSLGDFVQSLDAATGAAPLFYMVNCAHPTHLRPALDSARAAGASWLERFRGFRANASARSHAELDESTELDRGDVSRLAQEIEAMRRDFDLWVVGGCCGTDHEHLRAIASA